MSGEDEARALPPASAQPPVGPALAGAVRKAYQAPRLVLHGSVRDLTLGNTGVSKDANTKKKVTGKSDPRVKRHVVRVGTHALGFGLYLFEYKAGFQPPGPPRRHFGVMADEVERVLPEAVLRDARGVREVRYDLLGVSDLAQQLVD